MVPGGRHPSNYPSLKPQCPGTTPTEILNNKGEASVEDAGPISMARVCLTSRQVCTIFRQHLYRTIHLRSFIHLASLYRTLAARKQLAGFVRSLLLSLEDKASRLTVAFAIETFSRIQLDHPIRLTSIRDLMRDLLSGFLNTLPKLVNL